MKKLLILLLCFVLCISACGTEKPEQNVEQPEISPENSSQEEKPESTEEDYVYEYYDFGVKTWVNSIGTPWAQVAVAVVNIGNDDLFLDSASVDLEDSSGGLFETQNYIEPYPQIISPGESAFYVETIMLDSAPTEELFANWHFDIVGSTTEKIQFPVSDIKFTEDTYSGLKVMGRVENTTSEEQTLVKVCVIPFDANYNVLCHFYTYVDINPNDKIGFECSGLSIPKDIKTEDIASYFAVAFPHQYQF